MASPSRGLTYKRVRLIPLISLASHPTRAGPYGDASAPIAPSATFRRRVPSRRTAVILPGAALLKTCTALWAAWDALGRDDEAGGASQTSRTVPAQH